MTCCPASAFGSNRRARGLGISILPGVVLMVALGCGGTTLEEQEPGPPSTRTGTPTTAHPQIPVMAGAPAAPAPPAVAPVEAPLPPPTGKLIEVTLWDVKADLPIGYHERRTVFARNELPAEYTVLAAMPDSGPSIEATYSLAFEVNGQRQSVAEFEPYFLTRIRQGEAAHWSAGPGVFIVRAIAYEGKGATGAVMGTATVRFEIR
jgi:hypothetical protein